MKLDYPRTIGSALHGERLGEFWKFRISDFRIICTIEDERVRILVLRVGHRREVYRWRSRTQGCSRASYNHGLRPLILNTAGNHS